MTTRACARTRIGLAGSLLAAVVFLAAACGDKGATTSGGEAAVVAYMRPVGAMSEADAKLFEAAGTGDLDAFEQAVEAGANVGAADMLKRTPLFGAAFFNRSATANLLIARGADVNAADFSGFSPLHAGVVAGGTDVVAVLIAKGANINARVASGRTALHQAAATNQPAMVALLLEHGANPHAKDREGLTPAGLAARNGHSTVSAQIKRWVEARHAHAK